MDYLTMRLLFPRETVLSLLDKPELRDCLPLQAQRDVKPFRDTYVAVFVLSVEPEPECGGLRLRPVSTTVVGVTQTAGKSLIGRGFLWADTERDSVSMQLLAAHFLGEQQFVRQVFHDMGVIPPSWRNCYRNCGGTLDPPVEIVIEDPGAADLRRLVGEE